METVQPPITTTPAETTASSRGIFGTKIPASTAFLVGVLLFFLPFAEVRCNGTALAKNTGLGIAMGSEWQTVENSNPLGGSFGKTSTDDFKAEKQAPNIFAIAALALGVIGLLVVFLNIKGSGKAGLVIGLLSVAALICMLIDLKSKANHNSSAKPSDVNWVNDVRVTVDATSWFYIAVIAFLAAAIFSWQQTKVKT
jgi:amino acid transporter